jgi:hypothetical protein
VKERIPVLALKNPWQILLGVFTLFCLLSISACGGSETARVYDSARVLNTSQVQKAARNLPANVDVYTVNRFNGTQSDFQRAVAGKLGDDPNRVVMGIDTQHHYQYIARGQDVPLNSNGIAQASNAFAANYGNGDYTRATVAALNTMGGTMGKANNTGASPLPWLIPLLLIGGLLFFLTRMRRPQIATQGVAPRTTTYQPPQTGYPYDQGTASPRPLQTTEPPQTGYPYGQGTVPPPAQGKGINPLGAGGLGAAAGGVLGYELGKRQKEPGPTTGGTTTGGDVTGGGGAFGPGSTTESGGTQYGSSGSYESKKKDVGGGGSFGKGGSDYDTTDTGGGGGFGKGGSDYGTTDTGGGGSFGKGSDYDDR